MMRIVVGQKLPTHVARRAMVTDAKLMHSPTWLIVVLGLAAGIGPWVAVFFLALVNFSLAAIAGARNIGIFQWVLSLWLFHMVAVGLGLFGIAFAYLRRLSLIHQKFFFFGFRNHPIRLSLDHALALGITPLLWLVIGLVSARLFYVSIASISPLILGLVIYEVWSWLFSPLVRWFGVLPAAVAEQIEVDLLNMASHLD